MAIICHISTWTGHSLYDQVVFIQLTVEIASSGNDKVNMVNNLMGLQATFLHLHTCTG